MPRFLLIVCAALVLHGVSGVAQSKPGVANDFNLQRLETIAPVIQQDIKDKKLPGAVVLVGRGDRVVWQKVVGNRSLEPSVEPMTADTVFDLASLTKVVATTTAAMIL